MIKGLAVALLLLCGLGAARAEMNGGLTSPLVDRSLYKASAIERLTGQVERWSFVCDQIPALKRRFCSLASHSAPDAYGQIVRIDVSTGDDGKPAALLHLPLQIALPLGLELRITAAHGAAGQRHRLAIATCNTRECLAVWTIDQAALGALTAGRDLDFAYCGLDPATIMGTADLSRKGCAIHLGSGLSGAGFRAAVAAAATAR